MDNRIILAIDGIRDLPTIENIAYQTKDLVWGYKINDVLIRYGCNIIKNLKQYGKVMVDPKIYDIPNTMDNYLECLISEYNVDICTYHLKNNYHTENVNFQDHLAGVALLTSSKILDEYSTAYEIEKLLLKHYNYLYNEFMFKYFVCSSQLLVHIRKFIKGLTIITPGIRLYGDNFIIEKEDQNKNLISSPFHAIDNGSHLLVIGRPIMNYFNNNEFNKGIEIIHKINEEIESAKKS